MGLGCCWRTCGGWWPRGAARSAASHQPARRVVAARCCVHCWGLSKHVRVDNTCWWCGCRELAAAVGSVQQGLFQGSGAAGWRNWLAMCCAVSKFCCTTRLLRRCSGSLLRLLCAALLQLLLSCSSLSHKGFGIGNEFNRQLSWKPRWQHQQLTWHVVEAYCCSTPVCMPQIGSVFA